MARPHTGRRGTKSRGASLLSVRHSHLWGNSQLPSSSVINNKPRSFAESLHALGFLPRGCRRPLAVTSGPRVHLARSRRAGRHNKLLREYHTDKWVSKERLARISPTLFAARLLGDLISGFLLTHVVQKVRAHLLSEGIYWTVLFDPEAPWLAPQPPEPQLLQAVDGENASHVDDEAVYFMRSDAQQLVRWVTRATQIYNETCPWYGLTLNSAPGKSEAMVALRGKGAPLAREQAEAGLKIGPNCTPSVMRQ